MSFSKLGLSAEILLAVSEQGYSTPTPIQREAIPVILAGRDLEALAQTGTGKTAAFVLPIIQKMTANPRPVPVVVDAGMGQKPVKASHKLPRCLILVPTRELAVQVEESVCLYGKHSGLKSVCIFGGVSINPQMRTLRQGVDIVVATPGRLMDHMEQKTIDLSRVEVLVLDEADRMLDMGFIRDIRKIIQTLPKHRQSLMFSATFAPEIRELAQGLLRNPATVEVARRNTPIESVAQRIFFVDKEHKKDALLHLLNNNSWYQVLVFARTKHGADALAERMDKSGIRTAALHGNKSQNARQRALNDFKAGKLAVLVATDIAARGLDIDALPMVINYEMPQVAEDYIHRIGRTGRAGLGGEAISLVSHEEKGSLRDIERLIKHDLPTTTLPGFEPKSPAARAAQEAADRAAGKLVTPPGRGARQGRSGESRDGGARQGQGRAAAGGAAVKTGSAPARPRTAGAAKPAAAHRNGTRHH